MKKIFFVLFLHILLLTSAYAQMIPKGMYYQATARNLDGKVISNENVALRIVLFSNRDGERVDYYSEIHETTTNTTGFFKLIIGEGNKEKGEYGLVPWNSENIWMEVGIKDKRQTAFSRVYNSKLLAVPYALYAGTANEVVGKTEPRVPSNSFDPGVVSNTWSVLGNAKTDLSGNPYRVNSLGTTDMIDLILITNNEERLTILKSGDIFTKLSLEIGKNLKILGNTAIQKTLSISDSLLVKKNVLLNTYGGETINNGPFTVDHMSPTKLTGELIVDKAGLLKNTLTVQGATDLNSRLFVNNMSPTKLTGVLQVDSITDLNDALHVNNMSPTYLTGTLSVDKTTNLMDSLSVDQMSPAHLSGTLVVDKPTLLNDSLLVQMMAPTILTGTLTTTKEATFHKSVKLNDVVQSNSTTTGTLVVQGGVGLGSNLNVGGASAFGGPVSFESPISINDPTQSTSPITGALTVSGGTGIAKNLNVGGLTTLTGMTSILDTTNSFNTNTGALKVTGGVGVIKNMNVGGTTFIAGITQITDNSESTGTAAGALQVSGGAGILKALNVGGMTSILDNTPSTNKSNGALKILGGVGVAKQLNVGGVTTIENVTQSDTSTNGALKVTGGVGILKRLNVDGLTTIFDLSQSTSFSPLSGALKIAGGAGIGTQITVGGNLGVNLNSFFNNGLELNGKMGVSSNNSFVANFRNNLNNSGISIQVANAAPGHSNNFVEFRNASGGVVGRIEGENESEYLTNPNYVRELKILENDVKFAGIQVATASYFVAAGAAQLVGALSSSTVCVGFGACVTVPVVSFIVSAGLNVTARAVGLAVAVEREKGVKARKEDYVNGKKPPHVGLTFESGAGDYAEWLPKADAAEVMLPGYLVGMKNGEISKKIDWDSKPMVISTQPIVLGNKQVDHKLYQKVAFLGQVPVRVIGKVDAGDYILPSGFDDGLGRAVHPGQMSAEDYSKVVGVAWSASDHDPNTMINVAVGLHDGEISKVVTQNQESLDLVRSKLSQSDAILSNLLSGYKGMAKSTELSIPEKSNALVDPGFRQEYLETYNSESFDYAHLSKDQVIKIMKWSEEALVRHGGKVEDYPYWQRFNADPVYREFFIKSVQEIYNQSVQVQIEKRKTAR
jgi:hypothetical protein